MRTKEEIWEEGRAQLKLKQQDQEAKAQAALQVRREKFDHFRASLFLEFPDALIHAEYYFHPGYFNIEIGGERFAAAVDEEYDEVFLLDMKSWRKACMNPQDADLVWDNAIYNLGDLASVWDRRDKEKESSFFYKLLKFLRIKKT